MSAIVIGTQSVGYRDHESRPVIEFYRDPENGDESISLYPNSRNTWVLAHRIARVLARYGVCRVSTMRGQLVIDPQVVDYAAFDITEVVA